MIEWREAKLGELVKTISETYKFTPKEKVVFLNTSDIFKGRVLNHHLQESDGLPGQAKKKIKKGDLLFSEIRPANGRYAMIDFDASNYVVSTKLMVLRCNDKIDKTFFKIFITSNDQLEYLQMLAEDRSGTFPQITFDNISSLDILLPPLPEQRSISSVLSSLDDKIDLLYRQNKTLEAMAETLFQRSVFEGQTEKISLGRIIEIFDNKRVPLSANQRDQMKEGTLYPYYGAASIMDSINRYIFDGEFILFGEDGTVQTEDGFPILQLATGKFWVNNHAHVLTAKQPFTNYLLYIILKNTSVAHIVTGAVQPKINQGNLKELKIDAINLNSNQELIESFENYWQKIKANGKQLRTLESLRDTLLPKLMSGEVRVRPPEN